MTKRIHQFTCFNQDADTKEEYTLETFIDLACVECVSDYINDEYVNQEEKAELIMKTGYCLVVLGNFKKVATLWAKYLLEKQEA